MTEILYRWLDEELRIPVARDADTFLQQFSNGQLIGRVLQVEGVLPDKKFDQLRTNDLYEDRLHNFLVIGPYLKSLGVNLSVRQARDILSDKPGSLTYLIYQVYLALHKPRDHLRQPSPEPLPDAYKERLRESARPDLRDSGVTSLGLTCQCYGRDVTQTRITEGHLVKECQQRITKEGVRKKARAKEIQEQMTEEYMKGDSAKLWGRSFRSTIRSAARREKDRQRAEAAAVRQQIEHFDNTADLRRSKYEDVRNAEFLQTTVTPDMIPEALVNTEANQQFVHKLRNQLDRDTRARFDREKRRKQMYLQLRDQQRQQEEEQRELDLVRRLLRQGDYELRLAAHLTDIKRQKQIIIRNRLEKDRQMQERRQEEYERSVQQQMDLLGQKRMEHQEELLKESQLHRRLLQQRRDQKAQRRWQLAADVVTFCLDMAVLTVDYKTKSGDKEVPALLQNDWRELFLRGESLSGGGEPTELSATSVPGERQQALLQQHDLDDYLAVSGRWLIPGTSGKKRSASAQAKDDSALRVESAIVTGFVVHRLLRLVYPPKPSVQAPDRPTFTLMGAVMGKSYAGKTHCLKWVQSSLDVRHIVMHDLVKRSLAALERETQLELEAAGSGVMETLRIADILGTDQSNEDMQRYDPAQLEHQQRQETDVDTPEGAGESIVPDSATTAQSEGQSAPTSASDAPQADSAAVQEDGQKESGSQTKLKDQKSQESAKGFDQKPDDANKSGKSQKSAKSNGLESAEAQKQSDGSETNTPKSSAQTTGGSAEATRTPSNTKHKSSPSTKDITSAETDRSKMSTASIDVSDEATTSLSSDTVVFEYSRLAQLGRDVKQALESGQEVQDQTLAGLLLEAWRELPDGAGWIIEGFPNTLAQAELLEEQLVGKQYDSDEELDEVAIVVTPLPKPEPPAEPVAKEKGKKEKKEKDSGKKGKKDKDKKEGAPPVETPPPSPPPPPPEPVRLRVKPFRRSQLVPDANRRERPPPTSGLDLVVELFVSDEVAQQRRCQNIDRVSEQPDSGNCQAASDDHVTLAGKLFSYGRLREPLVEFYSERDVYHMVQADDLAAVETQLEKLIGASREKQREEHRLAERRAEMLAAAENEPDSEPELIPEPEPEVVDTKGKGKAAKSPKGGKGSADKGKKGKGKGKGDAEPEPAAENLPQIPAPPPMPTPGEMGYYFVDAPVPEGVAQYLALLWQQTERNYTENLKQWLGRLRLEHAAVIHHLHAITVSFNAFLLRPDHKQQFLDRFVTEYNLMEEALRVDEEVKCEWHLRIQELESTIWNITDTRRCEAEQERYTAMTSGWIEDRLALSANNWLMVMQSEMDRFQDTCLVLEDYYVSMSGAQLPEVIGRVHGFKQAMIEIPSREPADRSGASSAGSDRHSGSRSSSSARPLRRGVGGGAGRGPDGPQSAGSAILTTINLPQLRPKVQFVRGKNQADEVTTAVEGVIDSACKSMMSFVHDTKDKGDARVKQALLPIEEAPGGKKGAKKAATPKPKGGKKGAAPEEDAAEAELSTHREWAERALAEFQVAAREESSRVSARLALIRVRAVAELAALRQRAVTAFHGMWSAIEERYRRELQAAAHMADYLRGLVEQQQRAHYQLLLDQDRFIVRTGVLTHLPCLPASPPPTEEALLRDRLSLLQATGLWRQLHTAAPSGIITTRAFCFILQDLVACGVGTQELPALWMSLSQEEIESLSARIAAGAEVMSWRGLLYDLLEPWTRPDQFDLHEALAIAHVFDPQRNGRITREEALQVIHWMKPRLEELDEAYNRPYHTKRLLVDISGAPGDETVDYQTLLTWLCRSDDVLQSFLCALTVLEDKPIFISNPEDDPKYYPRRKVELNRIQSLPMQRTVTSPRPDIRSRKVRLTKSAPLNVSKDTDDEEGSEDTPKEVVLQATCSNAYHLQDNLDMNRPPSQMVGSDTLGDRLGASLENLPSAPDSADRSARTEGSQPSLSERRHGSLSGSMQSGGSISGNSSSRSRADTQTTGPADTTGSADSARSQLLGELTISVPAGHTLDSWTELAPSCCTHPAEAPPTTPSTDERAVGETGNKSTLNAIRTVLARTLVLPAELMPQALQRLDLDLALVHRDLYGGACCATVEALRRDEPLPVPILAVFQHDLTQRYLAPGQCTLLAGRPWQIIKDIRSPPPQPPPPAEATHAASVTGTGTSLSFKDPA